MAFIFQKVGRGVAEIYKVLKIFGLGKIHQGDLFE